MLKDVAGSSSTAAAMQSRVQKVVASFINIHQVPSPLPGCLYRLLSLDPLPARPLLVLVLLLATFPWLLTEYIFTKITGGWCCVKQKMWCFLILHTPGE